MSNINKPPILIFGASGAIGSSAAHILKKNKYNLLLSNSKNNKNIKSLSQKLKSPYFSFNFDKKLTKKQLENKIVKHTSSLQGLIISIAKPFPNKLIQNTDKKKRFTFITGSEGPIERKNNKEAFNHIENLRGEYIQLILISSAGAEGISLSAVRQVHIMEPYWHFGRINQVFGRAIRFKSHIDFDNEIDRTVEKYLYLSFQPEGNDIESIYQSLKENKELWSEVRDIDITDDIKTTFFTYVFSAAEQTLYVETILFLIPSTAFISTNGTCL